jgi:F-type H+-transporting ATPase subunit gamma
MSGTLQSLRRKIDGAGDLEGVVRAMKALAASSIGQYERAVRSLNDYDRTVELGLSLCLRRAGAAEFEPLKAAGPDGAIVFGSDQGLVGRFNETVVDLAVDTLKKLPHGVKRIWAVGDRTYGLLADAGLAPVVLLTVPTSVDGIAPLVGRILIEFAAARERGEVAGFRVFHNHPESRSLYRPVSRKLLPLDRAWQTKTAAIPWPGKALPEVMEGQAPALEAFVKEHLFVVLFQACAESLNSENASRLAAMERAENNIKDVVENLNGAFHRVRQDSIDEELFDVVSGFEALTKGHQ